MPADRPPAVAREGAAPHWLPDFCSGPVLFAVMVVAELLVIVILIAPSDESRAFIPRLTTTSVFAQWVALTSAVILCKLRPWLERLTPWLGVAAAYILMVLVTALASWLAFVLDQQLSLNLTLPPQFLPRFVLRNAALCALIGAALLRYFYVFEQWRARVRAEAKARFEALQARIRPHFLFNSMNTIASLIPQRPAEAERAVEDLADLFRAALGNDTAQSTLGAELDLVRRYLDIETLRLGDRLKIVYDIDALPTNMPVPALLLQPLIENAVYHGIQQLPEGGTVSIIGRHVAQRIEIEIRNPRPLENARLAGRHGMALANTRARIEYHFGQRGALDVKAGPDDFVCTVKLPDESTHR